MVKATMPFTFRPLVIPEVVLVEPKVFGDERGSFAELYKQSEFETAGIGARFVQINHSHSQHRVLRGLHYQMGPKAQGKLVAVSAGEVFDVAVDIRRDSPTYGQWVGEVLDADGRKMMYVPEGFAHGFCVLSKEGADVTYYCTEEYAVELERGFAWDDPDVGVGWPVAEPVLSDKDRELPRLAETDNNF